MATKRTVKFLKGSEMHGTWFGLRNQSKGMYCGGFNRYLFGVKNIFGLEIELAWGKFTD